MAVNDFFYTVKEGDSLWSIAQEYSYPFEELRKLNLLVNDELEIGQKLRCLDSWILDVKDVQCNICGWKGKEFASFDSGLGRMTEKTMCPECFSQPRHRAHFPYLRKHLPTDRVFRVLHFAPELSMASFLLSYNNIDYISVDLDPERAMKQEDITDLSFDDNTFDFIYCSHILEHVEDDNAAMKELYRVLSPGGFAIIDVPIDYNREVTLQDSSIITPNQRAEAYWQFDHVRLYGRDFPLKLQKNGFRVTAETYVSDLGWKYVRFNGLSHEPIYVCEK